MHHASTAHRDPNEGAKRSSTQKSRRTRAAIGGKTPEPTVSSGAIPKGCPCADAGPDSPSVIKLERSGIGDLYRNCAQFARKVSSRADCSRSRRRLRDPHRRTPRTLRQCAHGDPSRQRRVTVNPTGRSCARRRCSLVRRRGCALPEVASRSLFSPVLLVGLTSLIMVSSSAYAHPGTVRVRCGALSAQNAGRRR